ncbi:MAG: CRISPR-associated endoribonuclease Cas6 [Leptospiraceae bacterium]|nr:CRISPR-associated endoribonuclease Cas6 [Leptospiraceae bacterium]MCP5498144.1 CRISPR-associated endoribonuclease Cas6 [Leptospiraceae bacterium]
MRLKLILELTGKGNRLPIHYQYEISTWIHSLLEKEDSKIAKYLRNIGYAIKDSNISKEGKKYKPFTFSALKIPQYHIESDRLFILSNQVELVISFGVEKPIGPLVLGSFYSTRLRIGDSVSSVEFVISKIESLPDPVFSGVEAFQTVSPICVSFEYPEHKTPTYLSPLDDDFERFFFKNLLLKYKIVDPYFEPQMENLSFKLLNEPKSKIITFKANTREETRVTGFHFEFEIKAIKELIRFGYYSGFGEKNSSGFGYVEKI